MAIHLACPHCHNALRLPEDCGGETAKCPSCLNEFVISGGKLPSAPPICTVPTPPAGTVTVTDVASAQREAEELAAEHVAAVAQLRHVTRNRQRLAARSLMLKLFQSSRRALDESTGRIGGLCISVTFGGALLIVLASLFSLSASGYMITALVGILIAAAAYTPFSFLPSDPTLALAIALIVGELRTATAESQQQAAEEAALGNKLAAAQARYAELKGVIESRLHWLRTCQWQGMGGTAFETFLREVFQERGYEVETTAKTGDQGVDLILKRGGSRVAVQAKGYVGHSVGNGAIQQVHAGRVFHKCQTAAVVTNSTFTRPARDLAEQLDCKLVDGSQIVDLIEGRILL
jgi:hypothetical protein